MPPGMPPLPPAPFAPGVPAPPRPIDSLAAPEALPLPRGFSPPAPPAPPAGRGAEAGAGPCPATAEGGETRAAEGSLAALTAPGLPARAARTAWPARAAGPARTGGIGRHRFVVDRGGFTVRAEVLIMVRVQHPDR